MRNILLSILLTVALTHSVTAQQTSARDVRVQVRGAGQPVAQATVSLGARTLLTSADGTVRFQIAAGTYELKVERIGYAAHADTVRLAAGGDTTLVIDLEEEAVEEEEIVVTSTRGERRVQDEPVKLEVVTREEVEEKLLMTPGSIAMLLNETAGLRVQETAPALGGATIRVQGLRGRYTQLLSDGLPLYGGQTGSLGILQIPPMDLAQVEVIKGAASALYGSSALGGAVNLISRRPDDQTELLLNRTTRGGTDAVLWQSQRTGEAFGYTVLGGLHLQDQRDIDDDGWSDLPRYRRVTVRPRAFWSGASAARVMATAGLLWENREGGGNVPGGEFRQELQTRRFDAGTTARLPLSERTVIDVRASATWNEHEHLFGAVLEDDRHTTAFAEASLRGTRGRHFWVAGLALQRDSYLANDIAGFDYVHWLPALFAQDEISFSESLGASLSLRYDRHSEYGDFVAPRISLLVRRGSNTNIRMSVGQGYFGPTPFTEETDEVGLARVAPLLGLRAERARTGAIDANWARGAVELNGSVFGSLIRNAIDVESTGTRLTLTNLSGDTRTRGTELLARFKREPFSITAAHTWIRATRPAANGERETAPMVPEHSVSLVAVAEEHGEGRAGIEVYYTGRQRLEDNPYREFSRPYLIVGMLFERRIGRVRAFLNLENLTNVRQTRHDPLVRPAATSFGRWSTDLWAPVDGRTFNGGVRLQL